MEEEAEVEAEASSSSRGSMVRGGDSMARGGDSSRGEGGKAPPPGSSREAGAGAVRWQGECCLSFWGVGGADDKGSAAYPAGGGG